MQTEIYIENFKNKMQAFESSKILLLLSGGVDSMVLAYFLLKIKEELNLDIGCFHLNHMYRGIEADNDAEFVREFCIANSLKHFVLKKNIPKIAEEKKLGFELCARQVRLGLAEEIKEENNYDYIATAHHLNDSVESIMHNFIRGTSLKGLTGIDFVNGYYIRPFIDISKDEIIALSKAFNIEYREDKTNQDTDFTRNQIRHNIIPEILKVNSNFKHTLQNSAKRISEDNEYIQKMAEKSLNEIKLNTNDLNFRNLDIIKLDLIKFRNFDIAIQKRIIRLIIEELKGDLIDVYSTIIDEIIALSKNQNSGKYINFKNITFEVSRDKMIIAKDKEDEIDKLKLKLGENNFNGAIVNVRIMSYEGLKDFEFNNKKSKNNFVVLKEDEFNSNLVLRRRKAGDYIRSCRLKGKKKTVKRLFVDLKLSRVEKSRQVILAKDSEALWIAGIDKFYREKQIYEEKKEKFILIELLNL